MNRDTKHGGLQQGSDFKVLLLGKRLNQGKAELGQSRLLQKALGCPAGQQLGAEPSGRGGLLLWRAPCAKGIFYTNDHRPNPKKELNGD